MKVRFYRAEIGKKAKPLGSAWVAADGTATWSNGLEALLSQKLYDARQEKPLDRSKGAEFVARLPYVFDNPPYLWAVLEGK